MTPKPNLAYYKNNPRLSKSFILAIIIIGLQQPILGQNNTLKWWKPTDSPYPTIEGQYWSDELKGTFQRLPPRAEATVRKDVWNLSKHSTGLMIRFLSNAPKIVVRYKVTGNLNSTHMSNWGMSGVDLYGIDSDGKWHFASGPASFKDTVSFVYDNLRPNDNYHKLGREYRLYLPVHNVVQFLEIGVPNDAIFTALPKMVEKPIVVYGTSIAHGAHANRAGMSWVNILGRRFDRSMINLAFSGNGRLEKPLIDLINEIDAKIYILDCLPNLIGIDSTDLHKRIVESVKGIRAKHPQTPILLTEHAGYNNGYLMPARQLLFENANKVLKKAFKALLEEGTTNLYTLTKEEIGLDENSTTDGTHPEDYGMMLYANAYEQKLREILKQPKGTFSTEIPTRQNREPDSYVWEDRHKDMLALNKTEASKIVFFGNSITHNWGGKPLNNRIKGSESWQKYLEPLQVRNFGFGWDRVENVLWRVYHDELEGISPEKIVVNIGTNNLHLNTDEEIVAGLKLLAEGIKIRQPQAKLILMGILPRRGQESRVIDLNKKIELLTKKININYADLGKNMLLKNGKIDEKLFSDGLHPNAEGYEVMGRTILKLLK